LPTANVIQLAIRPPRSRDAAICAGAYGGCG
jgi:hypothetical protein